MLAEWERTWKREGDGEDERDFNNNANPLKVLAVPAEQVNTAFALSCHSLCFALKSFSNPAYLTLFKYLKLAHVYAYSRKDRATANVHMQGGLGVQ